MSKLSDLYPVADEFPKAKKKELCHLDDLLAMSDQERCKEMGNEIARLRTKRGKNSLFCLSAPMTKEEIIRYFREHNIHSIPDLRKHRKERGKGPSFKNVCNIFGSWLTARRQIWGEKLIPSDKYSARYILTTIVQLGLWSSIGYLEAHKAHPDVVPSFLIVRKKWKTYGMAKRWARCISVKLLLTEYLKLYRKLGHMPTPDECLKQHLDISEVLIYFDNNKKKLDMFVKSLDNVSQTPK